MARPSVQGCTPHPGLVRKPVPVLGQSEMVGGQDQAPERGLGLLADHGLGPALHRLRLEPAFPARRLDPAVHARAPDREPPGHRLTRLAAFHRRDHAPAQIA